MYDQLNFLLGQYQQVCWAADMAILPWGAIFMADFARGIIEAPLFLEMMGYIGQIGENDYAVIGQCIVDLKSE
jgi:hypothetical protein